MSTVTVTGRAIDPTGIGSGVGLRRVHSRAAYERTAAWRFDSYELRSEQPKGTINLAHSGPPIGRICGIERDRAGSVWVTGELDDAPDWVFNGDPWYYSVESNSRRDGSDLVIDAVALVTRPALGRAVLQPVEFFPGPLSRSGSWPTRWPVKQRIERARAGALRVRNTISLYTDDFAGRYASPGDIAAAMDAQYDRRGVGPIRHWPPVGGGRSILSIR